MIRSFNTEFQVAKCITMYRWILSLKLILTACAAYICKIWLKKVRMHLGSALRFFGITKNDVHPLNCLVEWRNIDKTQSWVNFFALSLNSPVIPLILLWYCFVELRSCSFNRFVNWRSSSSSFKYQVKLVLYSSNSSQNFTFYQASTRWILRSFSV
jgi:hypothetical protein